MERVRGRREGEREGGRKEGKRKEDEGRREIMRDKYFLKIFMFYSQLFHTVSNVMSIQLSYLK